jgi:hypothetical protein
MITYHYNGETYHDMCFCPNCENKHTIVKSYFDDYGIYEACVKCEQCGHEDCWLCGHYVSIKNGGYDD